MLGHDEADLELDDYLQLRGSVYHQHQGNDEFNYERVTIQKSYPPTQAQLKTLFSQKDPQLYFHKSPATNKILPNLNRDHQRDMSPTTTAHGASTNGLGPQQKAQEHVKHKLYVQPLMKFFHDCIDFERTIEISKQELVMKEDYSIYNVFKALAGPGKKYLFLRDL